MNARETQIAQATDSLKELVKAKNSSPIALAQGMQNLNRVLAQNIDDDEEVPDILYKAGELLDEQLGVYREQLTEILQVGNPNNVKRATAKGIVSQVEGLLRIEQTLDRQIVGDELFEKVVDWKRDHSLES